MSRWRRWGRGVLPPLALLAAAFGFFEFTGADLWVQDHFFDFERGVWLVDRNEPVGRAIFYNGPKYVIIALGLVALALLTGPRRWREVFGTTRRRAGAALLVLALLPVVVGLGKRTIDIHCPYDIRRYGGFAPYVRVLESYPKNDVPERRGGCFPAGHASGGFALMGLLWLRPARRWRIAMISLGIGIGFWMGTYQMMKGAHYLSHTVVTLLLGWLFVVVAGKVLRVDADGGDELKSKVEV